MGITHVNGHQMVEKFHEVLLEERFIVVDADRGRGVRRENRYRAAADPAFLERVFYGRGDVDQFELRLGLECQFFLIGGHSCFSSSCAFSFARREVTMTTRMVTTAA